MINNILFEIIAGKINKIPEFYMIFPRKMPDCIIRQRDRGQAEAKASRPKLMLNITDFYAKWHSNKVGLFIETFLSIFIGCLHNGLLRFYYVTMCSYFRCIYWSRSQRCYSCHALRYHKRFLWRNLWGGAWLAVTNGYSLHHRSRYLCCTYPRTHLAWSLRHLGTDALYLSNDRWTI